MKRTIRTLGILSSLVITANASAITFENSSHQMSAGDFTGNGENEVAYIKSTGAAGPIA